MEVLIVGPVTGVGPESYAMVQWVMLPPGMLWVGIPEVCLGPELAPEVGMKSIEVEE